MMNKGETAQMAIERLEKDLAAAKVKVGEQAKAIRNVQRALQRNENREINMGEAWALIKEAVADNRKNEDLPPGYYRTHGGLVAGPDSAH